MKTIGMRLLTVLVLGLMFCLPANAETLMGDFLKEKDVDIEITSEIAYYDKYVWRGFLLDNDSVLQPAVTISGYGFEGGFWGSWDLEAQDGLDSDEVDGWIGYGFDLGFLNEDLEMVGISFGHTWYNFPEASTYTKEFYLGVSLDTFLSPSFTWYHDYAEEENGGADGDYFIASIGHSIDLSEKYGITLDLSQELGYNNGAFINGEGGWSLTSIGLTVPLTEKLTMTPSVNYSSPFDDLKKEADGNQNDEFYGGVALSYAF